MIKVYVFQNPQELEDFLNKVDIHSILDILSGNVYTVIYEEETN